MDVDEVCDATDSGDWVGVAMAAAVMWLWYVALVGMFVWVACSRSSKGAYKPSSEGTEIPKMPDGKKPLKGRVSDE